VERVGGWGCLQSKLKNTELRRQVHLGHVPFFHILGSLQVDTHDIMVSFDIV
jgi:hypothetical protein